MLQGYERVLGTHYRDYERSEIVVRGRGWIGARVTLDDYKDAGYATVFVVQGGRRIAELDIPRTDDLQGLVRQVDVTMEFAKELLMEVV